MSKEKNEKGKKRRIKEKEGRMEIRGKNAFKKSEKNRLKKKYKKINEKEKFKVE